MKKYFIFFMSVLVLILASCKSTPKEEVTETPIETVQEEAVVEEVTEPEPVVEDFSAENQQKIANLEAARKEAIDSGAKDLLTEAFDATEAIYNEKNSYFAENVADTAVSAEIDDLITRYKALAAAAQGYAAKLHIDEMGLASYDKSNYDKGETAMANVIDLYNSGADPQSMLDGANEGKEAYAKVLLTGLKKVAATARSEAVTTKKKADSVYAAVAEKEIYKTCADKITKADSNLVTGDPEAAFNGYKDAAASFATLYESVSKKRAEAQAKIDAAKAAVAQAKDYAAEADSIAPLESDADGIEAEDATLLEEDTYEDPESATIDVNSSITGKAAAELEELATQGGAE